MDKWVKEISNEAVIFNKGRVKINVHILIEKDIDFYNAHCLEFDITADGNSIDDALNNVVDCIKSHVQFCIEMGIFDKIYDPAPQEYWNKLMCATPLKKFSFPKEKFRSDISYPIDEVETYEAKCRA